MKNYTRGPWTIARMFTTEGHDLLGRRYCEAVVYGRERDDFGVRKPIFEQCVILEGDADLITAAPELLEGLEQAVVRLKAGYTPSPLDGDAALIRKLEAIIAKATRE